VYVHCLVRYSDLTALYFTVLNPAIRLTWIEREWDAKYISQAKKIILQRVSTTIPCVLDSNDGFADAQLS
jgi:hypothetical protein